MPSIALTSHQVHYFKRAARAQFPLVKNSHLLEALARGFSFDTWAALNTALKNASIESPLSAVFTADRAMSRLVELGYAELADHLLVLPATTYEVRDASNDRRFHMLNALAKHGLFNAEQHATIRHLADADHSIMIAGATGAGKSTLMRAIIEVQAHRHFGHRIGLYETVREFMDYPENVVECLPRPDNVPLFSDEMVYVPVDGSSDYVDDFDTLCVDDMRDPVYSTVVLEKWRESGYGVATIHAAPGRGIERVVAVTAHPGAASLAKVIDACIYMEHRDGKPAVHSIDLLKVSRQR